MASAPPLVEIKNQAAADPAASLASIPNRSSTDVQRVDNTFCLTNPFDICFPCNNCFIVPEREHVVNLYLGNYAGTITQPGCYCRSALVVELRKVGTHLITYDLKHVKVLDSTGSPIIVSGIVTYEVVDARRAAVDVSDPHHFVRDQSPAVLKRVVSQFPYESRDPNVPDLRSETATVADRMRDALQQRVQVAGIRIDAFSIDELSYAPEVAQAMLRRQQAEAIVSARRAIVRGAQEIASDAVNEVAADMTPEQKATLLSNLLIILVGDKDVTPTLAV